MIKRIVLALTLSAFSLSANAAPELISPPEIQYGGFQFIETITITGDINDSLLTLVDKSLMKKEMTYYVIQDISEDTQAETLTVVVNLYNREQGILTDFQSV